MTSDRVLVVEDEASLRLVLESLLKEMGCEVTCAASGEEALPILEARSFSIALLDIVLPGMSGLEVLRRIKEKAPDTEVIMMTSHASIETAIDAIRKGAYDYLHKPFEFEEVLATLRRALEKHRLVADNRKLSASQQRKNRDLISAVQRLRALTAAGIGISSLSSVPEILDLLLDTVMTELDAARASVMLVEPNGDHMRIAAARGLGDEILRNVRVRRGEGVAGRVLEAGRAMLVTDTHADGRTAGHARDDLAASFLSVPIQLSVPIKSLDLVLGVVNVTNRNSDEPFAPEDAEFLSGLCGQVAVSLERARQTERLKESVRLLQAAQDRLIASERLNTLGEMAAGVAHDFNNILNGILGRAQLLLASLGRGMPTATELQDSIRMVEVLAHQGADAVRRIQDTARVRRDPASEPVDANAVVQLVIELTRIRWEKERDATLGPIEVVSRLGTVPLTTGSSMELVQALSNLVFNAVEAMPNGGRLTFHTSLEGAWIRIDLTDTGVGMTPEMRSRLFLPFHTTKPDGHGLGLSIVYGIVTRLGGSISAETLEGSGTTFTIRLPVRSPETEAPQRAGPEAATSPRSARILVVDDESYNREFYKDSLALDGHQVTAVSNGEQALAEFDARTYDLVITDLGMPGMTGSELTAQLKRRRPAVPVLMLSGWGSQMEGEQGRAAGADYVLSKPIGLNDLLAAVRTVLDRAADRRNPDRHAA